MHTKLLISVKRRSFSKRKRAKVQMEKAAAGHAAFFGFLDNESGFISLVLVQGQVGFKVLLPFHKKSKFLHPLSL